MGNLMMYVAGGAGIVALLAILTSIYLWKDNGIKDRDLKAAQVENSRLIDSNKIQTEALTKLRDEMKYNEGLLAGLAQSNKDVEDAVNESKKKVAEQGATGPASPAVRCALTGVCDKAGSSVQGSGSK